MSGHSKWANIKHRKAKGDAARAKLFSKIGREIAVAVKQGGSDPEANSKLKDVIAKAKTNNMPNENIMRGIKKAAGDINSVNYEEIIYEGYGISGAAVIVECLTDNKNRTAGDVRHFFDKYGGSLGSSNCVSFMFDKKGIISLDKGDNSKEDEVIEAALTAGADDVDTESENYEVLCDPSVFASVKQYFEKNGFEILNAEITYIPQNKITLSGEDQEKFLKMIECFEDLDDVQTVYHNVELPDEYYQD
jgi:YebC/PmpR family DNA-binding regulatory protein